MVGRINNILYFYNFIIVSAEEVTLRLYCERAKIEDGQTVLVGKDSQCKFVLRTVTVHEYMYVQ